MTARLTECVQDFPTFLHLIFSLKFRHFWLDVSRATP